MKLARNCLIYCLLIIVGCQQKKTIANRIEPSNFKHTQPLEIEIIGFDTDAYTNLNMMQKSSYKMYDLNKSYDYFSKWLCTVLVKNTDTIDWYVSSEVDSKNRSGFMLEQRLELIDYQKKDSIKSYTDYVEGKGKRIKIAPNEFRIFYSRRYQYMMNDGKFYVCYFISKMDESPSFFLDSTLGLYQKYQVAGGKPKLTKEFTKPFYKILEIDVKRLDE